MSPTSIPLIIYVLAAFGSVRLLNVIQFMSPTHEHNLFYNHYYERYACYACYSCFTRYEPHPFSLIKDCAKCYVCYVCESCYTRYKPHNFSYSS